MYKWNMVKRWSIEKYRYMQICKHYILRKESYEFVGSQGEVQRIVIRVFEIEQPWAA